MISFNAPYIYSQNSEVFEKQILADDYKISLKNSEQNFFTGSIEVFDRNNKSVFYADSFYTRYNWDTLTDLNNDGHKELILDLGSGATMYDYNMFLIFDFSKTSIEPLEVHNADLINNVDEIPKIVSNVRLSPNYLGAGYSYSLMYDKSNLVLEKDISKSKVLKSLIPDDRDEVEVFANFRKDAEECKEGSSYITYFEAYITQMKILGNEEKGWKLFNKYYNCSDKKTAKKDLKKTVDENYNYLKYADFKFNSNR